MAGCGKKFKSHIDFLFPKFKKLQNCKVNLNKVDKNVKLNECFQTGNFAEFGECP